MKMKISRVTAKPLFFVWWFSIVGLALGEPVRLDLTSDDAAELVQRYRTSIQELRSRIPTSGESHGIPVLLHPKSNLQSNQRYIFFDITVTSGKARFILDVTDLNLVAFRLGDLSYYFENDREEEIKHVAGGRWNYGIESGNGTYQILEDQDNAKKSRADTFIGVYALRESVHNLNEFVLVTRLRSLALLSVKQMISEAARYYQIEREIAMKTISENDRYVPSSTMLDLEDEWGRLSSHIQRSNDWGFPSGGKPIVIREDDPLDPTAPVRRRYIYMVTEYVVSATALLLFVENPCQKRNSLQKSNDSDDVDLFLDDTFGDGKYYTYNSSNNDQDICTKDSEPLSIIGFNNSCVDLYYSNTNNGTPIIMWSCTGESNQMWTLKADGTIRSSNKCLTAYGSIPDDYIMIYDCAKAVEKATKWNISSSGEIMNPSFGLHLTPKTSEKGSGLMVDNRKNVLSQVWRFYPGNFSNTIDTPVTPIITYGNRCLEYVRGLVSIGNCVDYLKKQLWALFADGSIRPYEKQNECLTFDLPSKPITLSPCEPYKFGQRYQYDKDGSFQVVGAPGDTLGINMVNRWFIKSFW